MSKLSGRIAELQATRSDFEAAPMHRLTRSVFAALAAGLTLFAYVTIETMHRFGSPAALTLPPVVATAPAAHPRMVRGTAYMAAMSTGMGVWPAVLMADEAPRQMADVELQQAALR